jgi:porphobilinogen deaminase
VLAKAGIDRLSLDISKMFYTQVLPPEMMTPAFNQGILAVQTKSSNASLKTLLDKINIPELRDRMNIERLIVDYFQADCQSALGVYVSCLPPKGEVYVFNYCDHESWCRIKISFDNTIELIHQLKETFPHPALYKNPCLKFF